MRWSCRWPAGVLQNSSEQTSATPPVEMAAGPHVAVRGGQHTVPVKSFSAGGCGACGACAGCGVCGGVAVLVLVVVVLVVVLVAVSVLVLVVVGLAVVGSLCCWLWCLWCLCWLWCL